jgi:hypothetical protein
MWDRIQASGRRKVVTQSFIPPQQSALTLFSNMFIPQATSCTIVEKGQKLNARQGACGTTGARQGKTGLRVILDSASFESNASDVAGI